MSLSLKRKQCYRLAYQVFDVCDNQVDVHAFSVGEDPADRREDISAVARE